MIEKPPRQNGRFLKQLALFMLSSVVLLAAPYLAVIYLEAHFGRDQIPTVIRYVLGAFFCVILGLAFGWLMRDTGRLDTWGKNDGE